MQISNPNILPVQITFEGSARLEISFQSHSGPEHTELMGKEYDVALQERVDAFDGRLGLRGNRPIVQYAVVYVRMAKYAISNMNGSISYLYGSYRVGSVYTRGSVDYRPHELYTAMPCRPFFFTTWVPVG